MDEQREACVQEPKEVKEKKPKGKSFYLKIIALALCCSLLGGIVGGGAVFLAGNALAEKELTEILDNNKDFVIGNHIRIHNPLAFHFGIAKNFVEEEILKEPYIGVSVSDSTEPTGALIETVEQGSPAARASVQSGDVITMVNNKKINSSSDLAKIISKSDAGDEICLTVCRQNQTFDCTVTVGEHSRFRD